MKSHYAFIINSAPGVGKSTILKNIHSRLPDGFAMIDGDDVGRVVPYQKSLSWLNVIQDNIADCCNNFSQYDYENCIVSFVFPTHERLNRLSGMLSDRGFRIKHIILDCSDDEITKRIMVRNTSKIINAEQAKNINRQIKNLSADYRIDTTETAADRVSDLVFDYILEVASENH